MGYGRNWLTGLTLNQKFSVRVRVSRLMIIEEKYFKYQDKIYKTSNLDKKLKKMKLTLADIELIDKPTKVDNEDNGITKHHFILFNGYTVTSIYDNLDYMGITNYKQID